MKFLKNWTIRLDDLPAYEEFKKPLTECINEHLCDVIIANKQSDFAFEASNGEVINPTWTELKNMRGALKNDKNQVKYSQKCNIGRFYGSSFVRLPKLVKHTLFYHANMVDLDQQKGHPTIAYELGKKNNKNFKFIKKYIKNPDKVFEMIATHFGIDIVNDPMNTDRIKWYFNLTIYGGGKELWLEGLTDPSDEDKSKRYKIVTLVTNTLHPFQVGFKEDCDELKQLLWLSNEEVRDYLYENHDTYASKELHEQKNCLISFVMGIIENDCLHKAYLFLKKQNLLNKYNYLSLEMDGVCFQPKKPLTDANIADLNKYVKKTTTFEIKYVIKPYKDHNIYFDCIKEHEEHVNNVNKQIEDNIYEKQFENFNKYFAKIKEKSLFVQLKEDGDHVFYNRSNFKTSFEDIRYEVPMLNKKKEVIGVKDCCFVDKWFQDPKKANYSNLGMFPNAIACPEDTLNLWKPFRMETVDKYTEMLEERDFLLHHIKILCNHDENVYFWFIRWIAQMIQYPEVKTVAPTLISEEGAGKGTLTELLSNMLGDKKIIETANPSRDIWGPNNNMMKDAFLVNINELSAKDSVGAEGQIKAYITDPKITISEKYINSYVIDSFHRFLITSNNDECIRKKKGCRRNVIIYSSPELCIQQVVDEEKKNELRDYHAKSHKYIKNIDVCKTMYNYFKYEIEDMKDFNKLEIPVTEHDKDQQELNRDAIDLFMEDFTAKHINYKNDENEPIMKHYVNALFDEFNIYCIEHGFNYKCKNIAFALRLKRLNIDGVGVSLKGSKGNFKMLNIEKMRKYYNLGCLIDDTHD